MAKTKLFLFEPEALCLARKNDGNQCTKTVRETDRISATRLIHGHDDVNEASIIDGDTYQRIFQLLLCGTHQAKSSNIPPSQALLIQYQEKFTQWTVDHKPLEKVDIRRSHAGSQTSVRNKLLEPISGTESAEGRVYVFTCADLPDMVKIGYVKTSNTTAAKRLTTWGHCHSNPKVALDLPSKFPHRVEELVHCELVGKRYDVGCPVTTCRWKYHNEWFKCDISEVKDIIDQWVVFMEEHALYDPKSLQLNPEWERAVQSLTENEGTITAQKLLDACQVDRLADALKTSSL